MSIPSASRRLGAAALAFSLVAATAPVAAAPAAPPPPDPRAEIAKRLEVGVDAIRPSVIPGVFEIAKGGEVLYMTGDGHYAIAGDIYDAPRHKNLTALRRSEARLVLLQTLHDDDTIVFSPNSPRYTVTVFTDIDCPYCRRMHSEMAEYNRLGVRVRYLFYPRSGPGTDSWRKAEAVWCAPNRQEALTRAKQGGDMPAGKEPCKSTSVARSYELGKDLGIRGTPGIFTDRGEYLPGYLPPAQLVEKLKHLEAGDDGG